jgi:hypothetical protein
MAEDMENKRGGKSGQDGHYKQRGQAKRGDNMIRRRLTRA